MCLLSPGREPVLAVIVGESGAQALVSARNGLAALRPYLGSSKTYIEQFTPPKFGGYKLAASFWSLYGAAWPAVVVVRHRDVTAHFGLPTGREPRKAAIMEAARAEVAPQLDALPKSVRQHAADAWAIATTGLALYKE